MPDLFIKPEGELKEWLEARGMPEAHEGLVIPAERFEQLAKHRAQAARMRYLGPASQEAWAVWTTYTHPGHESDWHPAGTREPVVINRPQASPEPIESAQSQVNAVAPEQVSVAEPAQQVLVVYEVSWRWRVTVLLLLALDGALHLLHLGVH